MAKATIRDLLGQEVAAETFSKHEIHDRVRVWVGGAFVGTMVCGDEYKIEDPHGLLDEPRRSALEQALRENASMVHLTPADDIQ